MQLLLSKVSKLLSSYVKEKEWRKGGIRMAGADIYVLVF